MVMVMVMAITVHLVVVDMVHSVAVPSVEAPVVVVPSALGLMARTDTLNILLALDLIMNTLDTLSATVALSACIACLHVGPVELTLQLRLTKLLLKSTRIVSSDDVLVKPLVKRLAKLPKLNNKQSKPLSQSLCKPSLK